MEGILVAGEKRQDEEEEEELDLPEVTLRPGFESDVFQTVAEYLLQGQSLPEELLEPVHEWARSAFKKHKEKL